MSVHAVVAEFEDPHTLLEAVRAVRELGYRKLDAYTPFAVHGMDEAMGWERSRLGWVVLGMGVLGAFAALMLQWWTAAVDYPLVVAGKPLFTFQYAVPITFELVVLFASFGAALGMLAINGLPRLYHPIFEYSRFDRAADDRFLLAIEADGPQFDPEHAARVLHSVGGRHEEVVGA